MLNLGRLAEEVSRVTTVHASAMALISKVTKELEAVSAELAAKAAQVPPVMDTAPLNDLIDKLKTSTDALAGAISNSVDVKPVTEVVLNAENPAVPTVSVIMPEVLPEKVEVTAEVVVPVVDTTSTEPQIVVTVEAATSVEPVEPVVSDVVVTPSDQVNVTVEVPVAVVEEIKSETSVDVVEAVKEAIAVAEVPAEPVVTQ
jgi:hypothetical protein